MGVVLGRNRVRVVDVMRASLSAVAMMYLTSFGLNFFVSATSSSISALVSFLTGHVAFFLQCAPTPAPLSFSRRYRHRPVAGLDGHRGQRSGAPFACENVGTKRFKLFPALRRVELDVVGTWHRDLESAQLSGRG
jgi:hypothetical protein